MLRSRMLKNWLAAAGIAAALVAFRPAHAGPPDAAALLAQMGFTPAQVADVEAGKFVTSTIQPSSEREIVAAFAFEVKLPPAELVKEARAGLLDQVDPNMLAFQMIAGPPTLASFGKLTLEPGAQKRAQAYVSAAPGGDLNLSSDEIASFHALGSAASTPAVEQAVRAALLARLAAYQKQGLAGIAPYALAGGAQRSPADELRSATQAAKTLESLVPAAYRYLLEYPAAKPPGAEESFRWSQFNANGTPTIALTHGLYVPDGDAWVVVQRQFYVSGGYNAEQAIGALLPLKTGSLAVYSNRTSTDQVTGFGGGTKRSVGSKLLASQLLALYKKLQARAAPGGG